MLGFIRFLNPVCKRIGHHPMEFKFTCVNYSTASIGSLGKTKKGKQASTTLEKKVLPVETDTNKLVKYVCGSNILKEGSDIEVKPDSEYPDWLWKLHTGKPKTLEELDPGTLKYWRKVRTLGIRRNNRLKSIRKF